MTQESSLKRLFFCWLMNDTQDKQSIELKQKGNENVIFMKNIF